MEQICFTFTRFLKRLIIIAETKYETNDNAFRNALSW